jgi:glycosyltransferase involved in cell wall biosynthesis
MEFEFPYAKHGLSIVLPAYNEEKNLEMAVSACLRTIPSITSLPFEVVVVNDGSRDQTGAVLDSLAADNPMVCAVHHPRNKGYGQAILTGFRNTRYDLIFFTDSDLQFDLAELKSFLPLIKEHDLVAGYRINRQDPWRRLLFAFGWNKLMRILFGLKIRDVDCAFKLYRREAIAPLEIRSLGAMFSAELLIRFKAEGFRFTEVGVHHYKRKAGKATGGQLWVIARAFRELNAFFWHWQNHKLKSSKVPKRPLARIGLLVLIMTAFPGDGLLDLIALI